MLSLTNPQRRNVVVLDPAKGMAKGEVICLLLQHAQSSGFEEND